MHIVVCNSLAKVDARQWNALPSSGNPFMQHEFLYGLEKTRCVCMDTGWEPLHLAVYDSDQCRELIAAMPCYLKTHSYGEYIFDWAWADAHYRHGLEYYPKLSNAVPFTPATGERWLIAKHADAKKVTNALFDTLLTIADEKEASSLHSLFLNKQQIKLLDHKQFLKRHSTQFHWQNRGYNSFDDFLSGMSSKKRKNIKRERRRIVESGIEYQWLTSNEITSEAVDTMYQFYSRTIRMYGGQSYLNKAFFNYLAESFNHQTLFLFAYYQNQVIAGGLYFKSTGDHKTLYGRYWGALNNFHSVHFETCYYQAIEWCISNGFQHFEAGAQGEHKLARGLEPTTTYSAHWIRNPQFHNAISEFVKNEQAHIEHYKQAMNQRTPFKHEV